MNKSTAVLLAIAVILVSGLSGFLGGHFVGTAQTGGDFPGGIVPSNLWTAATSTSSVSPTNGLPNLVLTGYTTVGGSSEYNQVNEVATASSTIGSATTTLGAFGTTTSSATSSVGIALAGLSIGEPCEGGIATTTAYVDGCSITAVGSGNATATVSYRNLTGAPVTYPTSTVLRIKVSVLPY